MEDHRIYRQPTYSNRPWVVYQGNLKLGSFRSLEEIKEKYPNAYLKSHKEKLERSERISKLVDEFKIFCMDNILADNSPDTLDDDLRHIQLSLAGFSYFKTVVEEEE